MSKQLGHEGSAINRDAVDSVAAFQRQCIVDCMKQFSTRGLIQAFDDSAVAPLFPGSRFCHQIHIAGSGEQRNICPVLAAPLDVVYSSLSRHVSSTEAQELRQSIIVDIADSECVSLSKLVGVLAGMIVSIDAGEDIRLVKVSGLSAQRSAEFESCMTHILKTDSPLSVEPIQLDRLQDDELLQHYRAAGGLLFVDTYRVLDAVVAGYPCTLLFDRRQGTALAVELLCEIFGSCPYAELKWRGHSAVTDSVDQKGYWIANDQAELLCALQRSVCACSVSESNLSVTGSGSPVIARSESIIRRLVDAVLSRRISFGRKLNKLIEDPVNFFLDSKNPLLHKIGIAFRRSSIDVQADL